MTVIKLGAVAVTVDEAYTTTVFADGSQVVASHAPQPGQQETATALGLTVSEMNRSHDLAHSLLAHWLGLPCSPTIYGVATKNYYPLHYIEEEAALALQKFAAAVGVDLVELAKRCRQ